MRLAIFAIFSPPSQVSSTPVSDTEPRDYLLFNKLKPTALPQLAAAGCCTKCSSWRMLPRALAGNLAPHTGTSRAGAGVNKMVLCSPAQEEGWNTQKAWKILLFIGTNNILLSFLNTKMVLCVATPLKLCYVLHWNWLDKTFGCDASCCAVLIYAFWIATRWENKK